MTQNLEQPVRVTHVIDYKIPLWSLIAAAAALVWAAIQLYFAVQLLITNVTDLQITVKSGNVSNSVLASEVSLIKFRMTNIEAEQVRIIDMLQRRKEDKP